MGKCSIQISILGLLWAVLALSFLPHALAQSKVVAPLYVVSSNNDTRLSTIWRYQPGVSAATPIFTLQRTTIPASQLFSARELAGFRKAVQDNYRGQSEPARESYPPVQTIADIWRFDETHLLIETSNELQSARPGGYSLGGLFGYYEFLLLDLQDTRVLKSLFKIDYHDPVSGGLCSPWPVGTDVTLNPKQDKFALVLSCYSRFTGWQSYYSDATIIVDYSTLPVRLTRMPFTVNPVWSPDGNQLAYLRMKCQSDYCDATVQVDSSPNKTTTIIDSSRFDHEMPASILTWTDNNTLIYEFPRNAVVTGDEASVTKWHNLDTHQTSVIEADWSMYNGQLIALRENDNAKVLVGYDREQILIVSPQPPFKKTYSFEANGYIKYNSRYPERVLLFLKSQIASQDQTIILNADLSQVPIRLSLPASEWVFDHITP